MLLSEPWALNGVDDVEAMVRTRLSKIAAYKALGRDDRDDAVTAMLELVVKLDAKWHENGSSELCSFSTYVWQRLGTRFIDYMRTAHVDLRNEDERGILFVPLDDDESEESQQANRTLEATETPWDRGEGPPEPLALLNRLDITRLELRELSTLTLFGIPLARGADVEDLAELHDVSPSWIRRRLRRLVAEIEAQEVA